MPKCGRADDPMPYLCHAGAYNFFVDLPPKTHKINILLGQTISSSHSLAYLRFILLQDHFFSDYCSFVFHKKDGFFNTDADLKVVRLSVNFLSDNDFCLSSSTDR